MVFDVFNHVFETAGFSSYGAATACQSEGTSDLAKRCYLHLTAGGEDDRSASNNVPHRDSYIDTNEKSHLDAARTCVSSSLCGMSVI
jgi:hypothetical protein